MKLVNKMLRSVAIASALLATASASATVIDTVTRDPNVEVQQNTLFSYTHDFTDQGFIANVTNYISGTLRVRLTDSTANENGTLTIGTQSTTFGNVSNNTVNQPTPNGTFVDIVLNSASLIDLNTDGMISLTLVSTSNAFYFADSVLTLQEASTAVPEPMSIALMGVGLLGVATMRRRRS